MKEVNGAREVVGIGTDVCGERLWEKPRVSRKSGNELTTLKLSDHENYRCTLLVW